MAKCGIKSFHQISKMRRLWLCVAFAAIALNSCGEPTPSQVLEAQAVDEDKLKLVLIKSQHIRFYDFGILRLEPEISLEVFKLGKSLGAFTIRNREICFVDDCAPKWPASKSFFGQVGYDSLFEEILTQKDIFEGRGKSLGEGGSVIQRFHYGGEEIYYERSAGRIYFKNLTTGMTISIEDYKK